MASRSRSFVAVVFVLLLVPLTSAKAASAPEAVTRELTATVQAMMNALASGKPAVWEHALADDAVVIDEFGRMQGKNDAVKSITGLPAGFSGEIRLLQPKARIWGDTAVLTVDADEYETVFGQKLHVLYRMTVTFIRQDRRWRMVAMHNVTVPTTPPTLEVEGLTLDDYPGVYRYAPERAFAVRRDGDALSFTTRAGRPATRLMPVARDVFMDDGDEKNLFVFRRDDAGKVVRLIERRKFNDLVLKRDAN